MAFTPFSVILVASLAIPALGLIQVVIFQPVEVHLFTLVLTTASSSRLPF